MKRFFIVLTVLLFLSGCLSVPPPRALLSPIPQAITVVKAQQFEGQLSIKKTSLELPAGVYKLAYQNKVAVYYKTESCAINITIGDVLQEKVGGICYQKKDGRFFLYVEIYDEDRSRNQLLVAPGIAAADAVSMPLQRKMYGDTDNVERFFQIWIPNAKIDEWTF